MIIFRRHLKPYSTGFIDSKTLGYHLVFISDKVAKGIHYSGTSNDKKSIHTYMLYYVYINNNRTKTLKHAI